MIFWRSVCQPNFVDRLEQYIIGNYQFDNSYTKKTNYWSSYFSNGINDESITKDLDLFYSEHSVALTKDVGVHGWMPYEQHYWIQAYSNTTKSHEIHAHNGKGAIISWVHILKAPEQKCFFFIDSYGEKHYPEQKTNDIFAFPSWALHGVDQVEQENCIRIVASGNIRLVKKLWK